MPDIKGVAGKELAMPQHLRGNGLSDEADKGLLYPRPGAHDVVARVKQRADGHEGVELAIELDGIRR